MKKSEFIKQMTEHGTQTVSRTDNSPRGYSTVSVEDIKPGDDVILNNSIVTIEADEPDGVREYFEIDTIGGKITA